MVTTYAYDGNGNRTSLADPLSQTTTFTFDALNRLTGISHSDGVTPNVTYSYDANGNRATMVDGTGTTSYAYDEMDRLTSVTSPGPSVVGYRYDLDGNRVKLIYPDSTAVTHAFDKASRVLSLTDWASRTTNYGYLPDGLPLRQHRQPEFRLGRGRLPLRPGWQPAPGQHGRYTSGSGTIPICVAFTIASPRL